MKNIFEFMRNIFKKDKPVKPHLSHNRELMREADEYDNAHKTARQKEMERNAQANSEINDEQSLV
jgi:hypothetical protein